MKFSTFHFVLIASCPVGNTLSLTPPLVFPLDICKITPSLIFSMLLTVSHLSVSPRTSNILSPLLVFWPLTGPTPVYWSLPVQESPDSTITLSSAEQRGKIISFPLLPALSFTQKMGYCWPSLTRGAFLGSGYLDVHQNSRVFLCRIAFQSIGPQQILV